MHIKEVYETKTAHNGFLYSVIYGRHKDGWFIAIPNWYVSTEASEPEDEFYNAEKLEKLNLLDGVADAIVKAVREDWEKINADL